MSIGLYLPGRRANAGHCLRLDTVTGKVHPFPTVPQVSSIAPEPDMPDFSVDSPTPVYVRVTDWIESRIKSGTRLPPERELASDCEVAYDTVRRATALLRERRLIITVHGRATYVA